MKQFKRNLIQLGNKSLVVTIPWEIVQELGLKKGGKLWVSLDENTKAIIVHASEPSKD